MALADHESPRIPVDRFGVRLAALRADLGGLNMKQAAERCEIKPETWRQWEAGVSSPRNLEATARRIASKTGYSFEWLMLGGSLVSYPRSFFDTLSSPIDQGTLLDGDGQPLEFDYPRLAPVVDLASRRAS